VKIKLTELKAEHRFLSRLGSGENCIVKVARKLQAEAEE